MKKIPPISTDRRYPRNLSASQPPIKRRGIDEHQVVRPETGRLGLGPAEPAALEVERHHRGGRVEAEPLPHLGGEQDVEARRVTVLSCARRGRRRLSAVTTVCDIGASSLAIEARNRSLASDQINGTRAKSQDPGPAITTAGAGSRPRVATISSRADRDDRVQPIARQSARSALSAQHIRHARDRAGVGEEQGGADQLGVVGVDRSRGRRPRRAAFVRPRRSRRRCRRSARRAGRASRRWPPASAGRRCRRCAFTQSRPGLRSGPAPRGSGSRGRRPRCGRAGPGAAGRRFSLVKNGLPGSMSWAAWPRPSERFIIAFDRVLAVDRLQAVHELHDRLHLRQLRALIHRRDQDQRARRRPAQVASSSTSDRASSAPIEWATIAHGSLSLTSSRNAAQSRAKPCARLGDAPVERVVVDHDPVAGLLQPGDHVNKPAGRRIQAVDQADGRPRRVVGSIRFQGAHAVGLARRAASRRAVGQVARAGRATPRDARRQNSLVDRHHHRAGPERDRDFGAECFGEQGLGQGTGESLVDKRQVGRGPIEVTPLARASRATISAT